MSAQSPAFPNVSLAVTAISLGSVVATAALFPVLGPAAGLCALIPVVTAGWVGGVWAGCAAAAAAAAAQILLLYLFGDPGAVRGTFATGGRPVVIALGLAGGAAGWLSGLCREHLRRADLLAEADRRFRDVETRYRCLIDQAADAMFVLGPDDRILDVNTQASIDLGYTRAELLQLTLHDVLTTHTLGQAGGVDTKTREYAYRKQDGSTAPVEARVGRAPTSLCFGAAGKTGGMWVAVVRDITRRRREEAALRESERRFRDTLENARLLAVCLDADGVVTFCNDALLGLTGYRRVEVVGRNWFEVYSPPADRRDAARRYRRTIREGEVAAHSENDILTRDGKPRVVAWSSTVLRDPDGRSVGISMLGEDVTDRKQAEAALRDREQILQTVLTHIPCGVFWKDRDSRYLGCNAQVARDLGLDSVAAMVGKKDKDLPIPLALAELFRAADLQVMLTGEPVLNLEEPGTRPGGRSVILTSKVPLRDPAGVVVGVLGMYQDITDRKRLEDQLRQTQKMEAVGQLAGGIAHDFNNLLTAINGFAELLLEDQLLTDSAREFAADIRTAGLRAADLTRQLLAFSRRQVLEPRVLDLNAAVAETTHLLRRLIGEDVILTTAPAPDLCRVKVDPVQLQQLLINLAVNARDAMPAGGRLAIETRTVSLTAEDVLDAPDAAPGVFGELVVSDTGRGMTAEVRDRIFEPFFTTKEVGKGTGLGLATVYGIVTAHGGHIRVESEPGAGTTFRVYLPRGAESRAAAAPEPLSHRVLPEGTETVLLAEDEPIVLALAARVLRDGGYEVLEARDGEDAIRVAEGHPGLVDILVTDVVMPVRGGRQVAETISLARPGLRVLFMSGYTDDAVVRNGVMHEKVHFLPKPFTPTALLMKVREVLDPDSVRSEDVLTPLVSAT
ncbi:MAG: Blue-light-activated protein [Gemmataceae bacterium]|nr:Blue-light-activated protein [Gemmataceae bacterium]